MEKNELSKNNRTDLHNNKEDAASMGEAAALATKDFINKYGSKIGRTVEDTFDKGVKKIKSASTSAERAIKNQPVYFVIGAAIAGFLVGTLLTKRR